MPPAHRYTCPNQLEGCHRPPTRQPKSAAGRSNEQTPATLCHEEGAPSKLQNFAQAAASGPLPASLPTARGNPGCTEAAMSRRRRAPDCRPCSIAPSMQNAHQHHKLASPGCGRISQTPAACSCILRRAGTGARAAAGAGAGGPATAAAADATTAVAAFADAARDASMSATTI